MSPPIRRSRAEVHRTAVARVAGASAGNTWVVGRVLVAGTGETVIEVPFPVTYGERPIPILGGGEFTHDEQPELTRFPTATAMVIKWDTTPGGFHYIGCSLAITTTGRDEQEIWVSFAFVGTALTNAAQD